MLRRSIIALVLLSLASESFAAPRRRAVVRPPSPVPAVHVAIFTHNEDPHHPETPDFMADRATYESFRVVLLSFAEILQSRRMNWNWQSDWNFLNATIQYEVLGGGDPRLVGMTHGKNIVRYLHEDLGVEIDPHSHENDGYNYADVAALIQDCGVTPSGVVGGHIYDPAAPGYQNWPRFNIGITGKKYPNYFWKPVLLMGAGTPNHASDPVASGMWRPKSPAEFFTAGGTGIAAFGNWDGTLTGLDELIARVESGQLASNLVWTASFGFNQSDLVKPGFLDQTVRPTIERLAEYRDTGRIRIVTFQELLEIWRVSFNGRQSVYRR